MIMMGGNETNKKKLKITLIAEKKFLRRDVSVLWMMVTLKEKVLEAPAACEKKTN